MNATAPRLACLLILWLVLPAVSRAAEHADLPPSHSVDPVLYATGFEFAEGPALNPAGDLFVVNYRANGTIGRITAPPDGTASIFCDHLRSRTLSSDVPEASETSVANSPVRR